MMDISKSTIIVPLIMPKYKSAVRGSYVIKDGKLYFKSGKNIVYIREHFSEKSVSPVDLLENTIRYDSENSASMLENRGEPCYNNKVNDVL